MEKKWRKFIQKSYFLSGKPPYIFLIIFASHGAKHYIALNPLYLCVQQIKPVNPLIS